MCTCHAQPCWFQGMGRCEAATLHRGAARYNGVQEGHLQLGWKRKGKSVEDTNPTRWLCWPWAVHRAPQLPSEVQVYIGCGIHAVAKTRRSQPTCRQGEAAGECSACVCHLRPLEVCSTGVVLCSTEYYFVVLRSTV